MATFSPESLARSIDPITISVISPTAVVFLCGGPRAAAPAEPLSLRNAFQRILEAGALRNVLVILAEDADPLSVEGKYNDLLEFEADVAQIVALIILFSESPGSLAELGAFSVMPTVAPRLLAIIDDAYYGFSSFVRRGPIAHLEHKYGDDHVIVVERGELGIDAAGKLFGCNLPNLQKAVLPVVDERLAARRKYEKFNSKSDGHQILLMTAFIQEAGALTFTEISDLMRIFGIELTNIRLYNYLYCGVLMKWIVRTKKGHHTFYVAEVAAKAMKFEFQVDEKTRDKDRWRALIRENWQKNDLPRFRAIAERMKLAAPVI